jgi:hypothetical protein
LTPRDPLRSDKKRGRATETATTAPKTDTDESFPPPAGRPIPAGGDRTGGVGMDWKSDETLKVLIETGKQTGSPRSRPPSRTPTATAGTSTTRCGCTSPRWARFRF